MAEGGIGDRKAGQKATNAKGSPVAVYVGHNLSVSTTEDKLLRHFSAYQDSIINNTCTITPTPTKRYGQVFFRDLDAATRAIAKMNGSLLDGCRLVVNLWGSNTMRKDKSSSEEKNTDQPKKDVTPVKTKGQKKKSTTSEKKDETRSSQDLSESLVLDYLRGLSGADAKKGAGTASSDDDDESLSDLSSVMSEGGTSAAEKSAATAYVGRNLPENVTEAALKKHFQFVKESIVKVRFINTKISTRIATVRFASEESMKQAISEYNGTKLQGHLLRVKPWVNNKKERSKRVSSSTKEGTSCEAKVTQPPQEKGSKTDSAKAKQPPQDKGKNMGSVSHAEEVKQPPQEKGKKTPNVPCTAEVKQSPQEKGKKAKKTSSAAKVKQPSQVKELKPKESTDTSDSPIKEKSPSKQKGRSKSRARAQPPTVVTFCDLSASVDRELLKVICSPYGTVVSIAFDQQLQTALVTFSSADEASIASSELNGQPVGGRKVRCVLGQHVQIAAGRERKHSGPSPAGTPASHQHPPHMGIIPGLPPPTHGPQLQLGNSPTVLGLPSGNPEPVHGPLPGLPPPTHRPLPGNPPFSCGPVVGNSPLSHGPLQVPCPPTHGPASGPHPLLHRPTFGQQSPLPLPPTPEVPLGPPSVPPPPRGGAPKVESVAMSESLHQFFCKRFCTEIASALKEGVIFRYSSGSLKVEGPPAICLSFLQNCITPITDGSLEITPEQWNLLMTAREGGTLFQTIYKPYIHNPNLHIDKKEDPFTVTIVGFKDSVTSAQESFLSKLERKISVDKMKLFVLTQLKPGLCDTIRSECKIRVFGFQPGSSEIVLEGDEGAAYMQARAKFLEELKNVFVHKKKFSMSHNDLVAILHYVKVKSVKVVLCTIGPEGLPRVSQVDTPDQCAVKTTVCGLKETDVNTVVSVLGAGPTVVTIEGVSSSQYRSLSSSHAEFSCEVLKKEYGVCLQYKPEQGTVSLCGFIKKDLKDVERRFKAHMCEVAETVTPFRCSKEEESLLVRMLFDRETAQGTQLKEEIAEKHGTSLRKTKSSGGIELAGPQDAADRVAQLIRDRLLRNFQLESFEFQCSPVIVEDIKAKVMEVEQSGLVAVRMNNSPIKEDVHRRRNIKLTAFSLDTDAFTAACKQLQELKPATKFVNIRPEEKEVITPEFTHAFQKQLGVRIHGSKKNDLLMVVHGLCVESVHKAVSYLRKRNFEMTHTPNLTVMQILFLRERYFDEISHISAHCRIVLPSTPLDVGLVHVTIEGQCHEVDAAVQRIDSLLEGFECRSTNLHVGLYDFCSNSEWKLATKSAIESESNVVVVYSPSLADRHNLSTCDFSRRHTVVLIGGTNGEELRKAEGVLSECLELTRCHLEASERDKTDLQAAIKNKRLEKGTLVTIRFCDSLGIELITPIRFEDKMEVLKSKITHLLHLMEEERYEQEIELEPLICRIIERKHADSFKPKVSLRRKGTSDSLILTGKKANVDLALARMREVVAPRVKSNLHNIMLEVADDRILYSKEMKIFVKSLEKAHCVDVTLPDRQAEENVVKWEIALPSHDCSPKCRLQIVHGILTRETTDAIVIANNQNLNLQDGLAGGVLRYRGHALDVNFGGVVCVSGGNPPSQKIIHAVCRKWTDGRHSETAILETAYYNSLETAVRNGCQSVAFSPIGAGVLNCPMEETARCAASALVNFLSKYPNSIPMIKFVVCDRQDVPDFEARLKGVPSLLQSQQSAKNPTTPSAAVRSVSSTGSVVQNVVSFLGYLFAKEIPVDQQRDGAVRNDPLWSPRLGSVTDARETVKDTVCIVVNGCEEDVEVVESQIKAFLRNSQTFLGPLVDISLGKQGDSALNTFSDWNLSDKSVTLLNVPPKSEEFKRVLAKMRETMPSVHLSKLERVQNPWLWRKYAHQCDLIREKNQNNLRELELFHGTRGNKPELIYGSEAGFDMRFCEQGLWGKGNYFAANAMYSHNYSHHTSGGMQQMFLARVIVGETYYCTPDRSLKMPPQKPARSSSVFSVERYDSVTGVTNGTQVYIIYDNAMAYPLYLITYIS